MPLKHQHPPGCAEFASNFQFGSVAQAGLRPSGSDGCFSGLPYRVGGPDDRPQGCEGDAEAGRAGLRARPDPLEEPLPQSGVQQDRHHHTQRLVRRARVPPFFIVRSKAKGWDNQQSKLCIGRREIIGRRKRTTKE
eukprot:scaffold39550_cov42-Prasinocladus_malaysianus.AAC.1